MKTETKSITLEELEFYIGLLKDFGKIKSTVYEEIIKAGKKDLGIVITKADLDRLYEPTIEEDIKDLELIYKNVT